MLSPQHILLTLVGQGMILMSWPHLWPMTHGKISKQRSEADSQSTGSDRRLFLFIFVLVHWLHHAGGSTDGGVGTGVVGRLGWYGR